LQDLHEGVREIFLDAQAFVIDDTRTSWAIWAETRTANDRNKAARYYARNRALQHARQSDWRRRNRDRVNARRRALRAAKGQAA
jgi:uncharacterized membrane protein YgaE (UPF0421/DUF939 family)